MGLPSPRTSTKHPLDGKRKGGPGFGSCGKEAYDSVRLEVTEPNPFKSTSVANGFLKIRDIYLTYCFLVLVIMLVSEKRQMKTRCLL